MVPEGLPDIGEAARAARAARHRMPTLTVALVVEAVVVILLFPFELFGGAPEPSDFARHGDPRYALDALAGRLLVLLVVSGITAALWAHWFFAVYRGVCALRLGRYLRVWGVLGWFIPYANHFVPKQMVNDLWRHGGQVPGVVQAWWTAYLVVAVPTALSRFGPALPGQLLLAGTWVALVAGIPLSLRTARAVTDRLERLVDAATPTPLT
ncbi:MAG TPA: DUF4328 domain-containing protein [Frankiaceae bacterium]|nr:DUF4328 domain-containing protein [Frankiaceae bacterium]